MTQGLKINKRSSMQEVLDAYPSAQRALFQRYHIGGCHSCGYEPTDILEDVAGRHGITDMDEILHFIEEAEAIDQRIQISPADVAKALKGPHPPRLVDVRHPAELQMASLPGAEIISEEITREIMSSPKDLPVVFFCHTGRRSMDAASYFSGHGYSNIKSMTGGIDAWATTVDLSVPRYEIARDPMTGMGRLQPLRTVVSEAQGCVTPKTAH